MKNKMDGIIAANNTASPGATVFYVLRSQSDWHRESLENVILILISRGCSKKEAHALLGKALEEPCTFTTDDDGKSVLYYYEEEGIGPALKPAHRPPSEAFEPY